MLYAVEVGWFVQDEPGSDKVMPAPDAQFATPIMSLDIADNVLSALLFYIMAYDGVVGNVRVSANLSWIGQLPEFDPAGDFRWTL